METKDKIIISKTVGKLQKTNRRNGSPKEQIRRKNNEDKKRNHENRRKLNYIEK